MHSTKTSASRASDRWIETAVLEGSAVPYPPGRFGWSVDTDGDTILVGAPLTDLDFSSDNNSGVVFAFDRDDRGTPDDKLDDVWVETSRFTAAMPVEGGEFWGPGGENWGIAQWDAGLEDEEAFAGFWGNANPGNVSAQGYPGEGNGGGGAGGYEISNALATAGGWWAGVAWHNHAMDFVDPNQVELTADIKGTWDPNTQAPGTNPSPFATSLLIW